MCILRWEDHLCANVTGGGKWNMGWCRSRSSANNVSICSQCMIGAGTVIVKNIDLAGTYIGVPARNIRIEEME